jgi:hypothetical protein
MIKKAFIYSCIYLFIHAMLYEVDNIYLYIYIHVKKVYIYMYI